MFCVLQMCARAWHVHTSEQSSANDETVRPALFSALTKRVDDNKTATTIATHKRSLRIYTHFMVLIF